MTDVPQQGLLDSNERHRLLVDEAPDIIIVHAPDGRIVEYNQQALTLLRHDRASLLALTIHDIEGDTPDVEDATDSPAADASPGAIRKTCFRTRDDRLLPVEVRSTHHESTAGPVTVLRARVMANNPKYLATCPRDFADELLAKAPVIALVLDSQGTIQYANPYFEQLTGYRLDEIQGKEWFETFLPAEDRDRIRMLFRHAWGTEPTRGNINPILTRRGEPIQIEWHDDVLRDARGEVSALLAIGQDVTERQRIAAELEQSRAEWVHAMDTFHDPVYLLDDQRRFVRGNEAFYRMVNATEAELLGRHIAEIIHPDGETVPCPVCQAQEAKHDTVITMEADHPDNPAGVPIEVHCRMLRNGRQEPTGIVMSIHDLSRSRQDAERLRESEARLAEAQQLAHIGNWCWDIEQQSLAWSDEIYRIFGLRPQEFGATYEAFLDRVHPADRDAVKHAVDRALYENQPYQIDHRISMPDSAIKSVHERGEVRYDEQGRPVRMIGTVQDITDRKENESRLLQALDEKEVLLRELHHRVKNNMQVISSLLSLQARHSHRKGPSESLLESRQRIRAMALIHERLYSAADLSHVDFKDYLRYLGERLGRLYNEPGVELRIDIEGPTLRLPVDLALPCALISNELLTNTILHAYPPEQLTRPVHISLGQPDEAHYRLVFRDFGVGMQPRPDATEADTLGLIIIRSLASQLGGKIRFEINDGTTAILSFPCRRDHSTKKKSGS